MDIEMIATAISVTGAVFFLFLQPLKVQLKNIDDTMQEVKSIIEHYRAHAAHMSEAIAVHARDIKDLRQRQETLEAQLRELGERECCRAKPD